MPVRARLLDLGQVSPLRAHSLRLAVAEASGRQGEPAVLLACAATPAITVGASRDLAAEVDIAACACRQVPVLRLPGDAPACAVGEGSLLVSLCLPREWAARPELPASGRWLGELVSAAAGTDSGADAEIAVDRSGDHVTLTASIGGGDESRLDGLVRRRPRAARGGGGAALRSPAELAEALVQLLEQRAGLELVPSMPTPQELEAVYEWDRRLPAMAGREVAPALAGPVA